ncbi:MAG: DUF1566 domain-containing protein [Deltaproteobacteria bacterium]|jgi:hypothetical protein|nr:DUF1566 domain-containing protein [Deltaproteobacteria bacterium]
MRKSIIFTLVVVIGFCLTGYVFADDKALESAIYNDNDTGLEWLVGPDKPTSWNDAKKWVESLTAVAGGGWRMPTMEELKTLYQKREKCNIKTELKTTGCWVWSGETKDASLARGYDYLSEPGGSILSGGTGSCAGPDVLKKDDSTDSTRGFAVRYRK